MIRRQHQGRPHFLDQRTALLQERLPAGIASRGGAGLRAGGEILVGPDVADFVRLAGFGLPEPDDLRVFLPHLERTGEGGAPLAHGARLQAVIAKFVDVAVAGRRLRGDDRIHQADVLADDGVAVGRAVLVLPPVQLGERRTLFRTVVEAFIFPHMHALVQRPDLRHPVADELAVIVATDLAAQRAGILHMDHRLAGLRGVGAQFVEHRGLPGFIWLGIG